MRIHEASEDVLRRGWVVEHRWVYTHKKTGEETEHVSYWYGPDSGWGTTSGPLDSAAIFTSQGLALAGLRKVYGRTHKARGYKPVRYATVRTTYGDMTAEKV